MTTTIEDIRSMLEKRLAELGDERRRLEGALTHLGGAGQKDRRSTRSTKKSVPRRPRRRARRGERADQLLEYIGKNPESRGSEISRSLGMPPSQVYQLAGRLEKEGRLTKTEAGYSLRT
jgi:hypothetical protein